MTDATFCPGPPEAPIEVTQQWVHRWAPVVAMGMPGELMNEPPRHEARVVEVCASCRSWRLQTYRRLEAEPPASQG